MDKYREKFRQERSRYAGEPDALHRADTPSPSDIYTFNGEVMKEKAEGWDSSLQELFREQQPQLPLDLDTAPDCAMADCKPPPAHQMAALASHSSSLLWRDLPSMSRLDINSGGFLKRSPRDEFNTAFPSPTAEDQAEAIRLGKDEKIAREAGISFNVKDIVNLPMDEFNDLLSRHELTEEQLNLCRDIRRRGKNKVAAQNCRKRKIDQIDELQDRLNEAMHMKSRLKDDHGRLLAEYDDEAGRLARLTEKVLWHHGKSPSHYTVQVEEDQVQIVPLAAARERGGVAGQERELLRHRPDPLEHRGHHFMGDFL